MVGFGRLWFPKPGEEPVTDAYLLMRIHPEVRNQGLEEEMLEWG